MCQIERLENREENGGNTPDRYRALATWNSIKMNIYGFLQSTKGLKSPFHFEDGGYEIDSATLSQSFSTFPYFLNLLSLSLFLTDSFSSRVRDSITRNVNRYIRWMVGTSVGWSVRPLICNTLLFSAFRHSRVFPA